MQHAADVVLALALKLLALVTDAIALVEAFLRQMLTSIGIGGPVQTVILILVGLLLVLAAFQLFGRIFLALLAVFLLLLLLRAVAPSIDPGLHRLG